MSTIKFKGYIPTKAIELSIPGLAGNFVEFTGIKVPVQAELFGIEGVDKVSAHITNVLMSTKYSTEKATYGNTAIISTTVTADIVGIALITFELLHIYPAESFAACTDKPDGYILIRLTDESDSELGMGLKSILKFPDDGKQHDLAHRTISSLFCIPTELAKLGGLETNLTLLRSSGAKVRVTPYI